VSIRELWRHMANLSNTGQLGMQAQRSKTFCGLAAILSLLLGGCAAGPFRATELPQHYRAAETENVEEIDLSRLANYWTNSRLIDRGDVLEVTIVTNYHNLAATTTPVRVGENGAANIPLIGPVSLAGLELEGAEQTIAAAGITRGVFRNPHVTVTMKRQRTNKVTVIGAVEEPGVYELPRASSSLLAAVVGAGGLAEDAGSDVEIRRSAGRVTPPGPTQLDMPHTAGGTPAELTAYHPNQPGGHSAVRVVHINLTTAATDGDDRHWLGDGDVVVVSRRTPKPIYVMGLVRKPGEYEMPPNQDMYLLDALAKAGDRTLQVADKVYIIRRVPGEDKPIVIQSSIRQAKHNELANVRLAPGDTVSVEETPATVLVDTLKSFMRFGISSSVPMF
jgi:polysaccharide export outer membrane protein